MTSSMLSLRVVSQMGTPLAAPLHARFDAGGTIGRSPDCTLVLPDPGRHISREQARIERVAQGGQHGGLIRAPRLIPLSLALFAPLLLMLVVRLLTLQS